VTYKVKANLELEEEVIKLEKNRAGRFVLATNILDKNKLTSDALLKNTKNNKLLKEVLLFSKTLYSLPIVSFLKILNELKLWRC